MKSKASFTELDANEIIALIKLKLNSKPSVQKTLRQRIRNLGFYASDFGFNGGYTVEQFLSVCKIDNSNTNAVSIKTKQIPRYAPTTSMLSTTPRRSQSDETYILDICDHILNQKAMRQHRFDFLTGDSGTRLPVDAFYPDLNLVIEYHERQHTEEIKLFDNKATVSGVSRGEQRRLYDQRRRDLIPKYGMKLIELDYTYFAFDKRKKLLRNAKEDLLIIKKILHEFL